MLNIKILNTKIFRWIHPVEARPGLWAEHRPQAGFSLSFLHCVFSNGRPRNSCHCIKIVLIEQSPGEGSAGMHQGLSAS